jgi:hypothetical protein
VHELYSVSVPARRPNTLVVVVVFDRRVLHPRVIGEFNVN